MCALSNRIREKPSWWEKAKDQTILEGWREEALQQAWEDRWKLTPGMANNPPSRSSPVVLTSMSPGQVRA